jgi:hypothetical protein
MKLTWFLLIFSISIVIFPAVTAAIEDPIHRITVNDGAYDLVLTGHRGIVTDELTGYQDLVANEADPGTALNRAVTATGSTKTTDQSYTVTFQGDLVRYMVRSGGVSLFIYTRKILDDPEDFLDLGDYVQVDYIYSDSEPEYQINYVIDPDIESGDVVEVFCSNSFRLGDDHYVRRIDNPQFTPPILTLEVTQIDNLSVTVDPDMEPKDWTKKTLRIHWDWGDGETDDRLLAIATYVCEGECPDWDGLFPPVDPVKHTYSQAGTYTIKAIAYITRNQTAEASVAVTVGTGAGNPAGIGDGSAQSDLIDRHRNRDSTYSDLIDNYRDRESTYSNLIDQYRNHDSASVPVDPDDNPDSADSIPDDRNDNYDSAYSNLIERYQNRDSAYSNLIEQYRIR